MTKRHDIVSRLHAPPRIPPSGGGGGGGGTTLAKYFSADSIWNTPIGANPSVWYPVGSSQAMSLYNISGGVAMAQGSWTGVNYYIAHGSNPPLRSWKWADGTWHVDNVPTPADLYYDSDPNNHGENYLSIIDEDNDIVWNIADAIPDASSPSGWRCQSAAPRRLYGSGVWDGIHNVGGLTGPWNGRASGAAYLAGLILKSDLAIAQQLGYFPHALCWALPKNSHTTYPPAPPFTTGDGTGSGSGVAPYGAHWQLDPNWDISGYTIGQQWVLRTLQVFGAYDVDSTNPYAGCTIYCENYIYSQTNPGVNPYPSEWSQGLLGKTILPHMRILSPPPTPVYDHRDIFHNPYK
jgi:hypothetical protein